VIPGKEKCYLLHRKAERLEAAYLAKKKGNFRGEGRYWRGGKRRIKTTVKGKKKGTFSHAPTEALHVNLLPKNGREEK